MRNLFLLLISFLAVSVYAQSGESFVVGTLNDNTVYVGEPVIYTLRIHLLGEGAESQVIPPNLVGFGQSSLQLEPVVSSEVFGTDLYTIVEQNYLLFPLRIGIITIEPFQVQAPETPFHSGMTISTDPVTLTVLPLPPNAPASFRNAIGQFEIEASSNLSELRSGDALTLTVTVSGSGNIEQLLAPELSLPEGWRSFVEESHFEQDSLLFGRKTFSWTIFPIGEGAVELPSIEFSYFNPQNEEYESRRSAPIALNLSPSAAVAAPVIPTRSPFAAEPIALMSPQFGLEPNPPLWFWSVWFVPPVLSLGIWLLRRPRIQKAAPQAKTASASRAFTNFRRQLKAAQNAEPKAAYEQIEAALNDYLSAKRLDTQRLPAALKMEISACLEEASTGRYAPISAADVTEMLRRSLGVVTALEKERP